MSYAKPWTAHPYRRRCLHLFESIDWEDLTALCRCCGETRDIDPEDALTPTELRESRELRKELQDL